MNIDAKILKKKKIANGVQQYIKNIIHQEAEMRMGGGDGWSRGSGGGKMEKTIFKQ